MCTAYGTVLSKVLIYTVYQSAGIDRPPPPPSTTAKYIRLRTMTSSVTSLYTHAHRGFWFTHPPYSVLVLGGVTGGERTASESDG